MVYDCAITDLGKNTTIPISNNHFLVSCLETNITPLRKKKIQSRGWSSFKDLQKFFPMVIWFLIFAFFLMKLQPTKVKRSEFPKSNNNL